MYQTLSDRFEPLKVVLPVESPTIPDMAYTPREIISKFSRGERVPLGMNGLFDSEDDPGEDMYERDKSMFEDDPTRDPAFDFGDYVEEKQALQERERERRERAKRSKVKAAQKPERKASEDELSASDARTRATTSGGSETAATVTGRD